MTKCIVAELEIIYIQKTDGKASLWVSLFGQSVTATQKKGKWSDLDLT